MGGQKNGSLFGPRPSEGSVLPATHKKEEVCGRETIRIKRRIKRKLVGDNRLFVGVTKQDDRGRKS
jgi:hypothetical protein